MYYAPMAQNQFMSFFYIALIVLVGSGAARITNLLKL